MAILVTGGAGYIGSHTCVELQNAGYDVVVLDNLSNSSEKSLDRVKAITGKDVKFYKGIIESVETDGGLTCNVRLDETGELIKIYNMDSIVVMEYSSDSDRITNNYDTLIGRKIKISKDANGKIAYDIAYKKKIRISLLYLIIGVTLFLVSLMQ